MALTDEQLGRLLQTVEDMGNRIYRIDNFITEKAPSLFAGKWVETSMKAFIGFIVFAVLGAVIGLAVINPVKAAFLTLLS